MAEGRIFSSGEKFCIFFLCGISGQWVIFFFFQAEDGIRDVAVTGVQTCALPIFQHDIRAWRVSLRELASAGEPLNPEVIGQVRDAWRSEERRVGKECRSRWS